MGSSVTAGGRPSGGGGGEGGSGSDIGVFGCEAVTALVYAPRASVAACGARWPNVNAVAVASGIILQLTVVLALAGGVVLFGESLSPAEIAGSLLTMCGVAWVVIGGRPPRPVAAPGPLATPPIGIKVTAP